MALHNITSSGDSDGKSNNPVPGSNSIIILRGSHFHAPLPMASLLASGICLLCFVFILVWYAWIKNKNKQTKKLLRWTTFGVSAFFMTLWVPTISPNTCIRTRPNFMVVDTLALTSRTEFSTSFA